jgi:hypothetical protein
MEAILAILGTQAGQLLLTAGVTQALSIANGTPPDEAAATFAVAAAAWSEAAAAWAAAQPPPSTVPGASEA